MKISKRMAVARRIAEKYIKEQCNYNSMACGYGKKAKGKNKNKNKGKRKRSKY